ncbi:MAG: class I SAM-dependent methyltransferase [Candidatus Odinarchaeota archaeon]
MYEIRFGGMHDFRQKMYRVLCDSVFQEHVSTDAVILEIGTGDGEFINNINALDKFAVDIRISNYLNEDVTFVQTPSTDLRFAGNNLFDVVFASNLFEHLTREEIDQTIVEMRRVLKDRGKFLILQPSFPYCYKDYFRFADHVTPVDHRALIELLELSRFEIKSVKRLLPYSTKSRFPKSLFLLKLYLRLPLVKRVFGKQVFIVAEVDKSD